jgi:hypothetical protein
MRQSVAITAVLAILFWTLPVSAQHEHQHGGAPAKPGTEKGIKPEAKAGNESARNRTFLLEGGIKAAFSIMPMGEHKKMLKEMKMKEDVASLTTHNIAVALTDTRTNLPITDAAVKMKVIDPKGKEQTKLLDFMKGMNQYGGDFTLADNGRYQILLLFKWAGKKYPAGFYYLLK